VGAKRTDAGLANQARRRSDQLRMETRELQQRVDLVSAANQARAQRILREAEDARRQP
jgi:hypothetical protein